MGITPTRLLPISKCEHTNYIHYAAVLNVASE